MGHTGAAGQARRDAGPPESQMAGKRRPIAPWAPGGSIYPTRKGRALFAASGARAPLAVSGTAAQRAPDWRQKAPQSPLR